MIVSLVLKRPGGRKIEEVKIVTGGGEGNIWMEQLQGKKAANLNELYEVSKATLLAIDPGELNSKVIAVEEAGAKRSCGGVGSGLASTSVLASDERETPSTRPLVNRDLQQLDLLMTTMMVKERPETRTAVQTPLRALCLGWQGYEQTHVPPLSWDCAQVSATF